MSEPKTWELVARLERKVDRLSAESRTNNSIADTLTRAASKPLGGPDDFSRGTGWPDHNHIRRAWLAMMGRGESQ